MLTRGKYVLLMIVMVASVLAATAQTQTSSYGELQAAYMYNFAKYISWPAEGQQFIIGVHHNADIMADLESTLKGKKVRGIPIVLREVTTPEELLECNIVYLSESNSRRLEDLLSVLSGKSVLIVTELDLIKKGATISFVVEDDRLRFKVKRKQLDRAGLVASDGLLKLAILI